MKEFWDSSCVVPLFVEESTSPNLITVLAALREVTIWRGTPVEVASAIARRAREARTDVERQLAKRAKVEAERAFRSPKFRVMPPREAIFDAATELVFRHRLRAADALQLAAALDLQRDLPGPRFRCADLRLADAARAEGLGTA